MQIMQNTIKYMKTIFFILVPILVVEFNSCAQNRDIRKYLHFDEFNHKIDTISRVLIMNQRDDSVFKISYSNFWRIKNKPSTDTILFTFPMNSQIIKKGRIETRLISIKRIFAKGKTHEIFKYILDDPNGEDEEYFYFYSYDFGILIAKSGAWEGYDRIIEMENKEQTQVAFYLCDKIISDEDFLNSWR